MSEWLKQRFMRRSDHESVIGFYKKVIAHQAAVIRALQADRQADIDALAGRPAPSSASSPQVTGSTNVVKVDFHRAMKNAKR